MGKDTSKEREERLKESKQLFDASLRRFKNTGVKEVRVMTVNDQHVCDACKGLASRAHAIDKVPSLPYKGCTCEMGCRCFVRPIT